MKEMALTEPQLIKKSVKSHDTESQFVRQSFKSKLNVSKTSVFSIVLWYTHLRVPFSFHLAKTCH